MCGYPATNKSATVKEDSCAVVTRVTCKFITQHVAQNYTEPTIPNW